METVTDRTSNPFGMRAPCEGPVHGYGDPNADFHVVGDHPGIHGGIETGVPFTGSVAGERLQGVLHEVGFAAEPLSDRPDYENLFASYLCLCPLGKAAASAEGTTAADGADSTEGRAGAARAGSAEGMEAVDGADGAVPADGTQAAAVPAPTEETYARLERFFDAELRGINAHVLLPVGPRPTDHVLRTYTTQARSLDGEDLHARELRGRGFLVVPVREPADWADGDRERLVARLADVLGRDYRQTKGVATLVG